MEISQERRYDKYCLKTSSIDKNLWVDLIYVNPFDLRLLSIVSLHLIEMISVRGRIHMIEELLVMSNYNQLEIFLVSPYFNDSS